MHVAKNVSCVKTMNILTRQFGRLTLLVIAFFMCAAANSTVRSNEAIAPAETSDSSEPYFTDKCIGGTAHELVAQANLVTAKKHPEYGLSEDLAVSCLRFVWVVLQADSLSADDKKRVFADVMTWTPDQKMKFFVPLKEEVDRAAEAYWKQGAKPN